MWLHCSVLLLIFSVNLGAEDNNKCDANLRSRIIQALTGAMQYMVDNKHDLNIDAATLSRMVADQAELMLQNSPDVKRMPKSVRDSIKQIQVQAEKAVSGTVVSLIFTDYPIYKDLGGTTQKGAYGFWYKSRPIQPKLLQQPDENLIYDFNLSDYCIEQAHPLKWKTAKGCNISDDCWKIVTTPEYDDYGLTHQLLIFQLAEGYGCFSGDGHKLDDEYLILLQNTLCTNIYRDAEKIARNKFPLGYMDLFMEQISLCGMYGFKDFFKLDWVEAILSMILPNGCFTTTAYPEIGKVIIKGFSIPGAEDKKTRISRAADNQITLRRQKRTEKMLPGNCSAHATGTGAMSLLMELRFCIESMAEE